MLGPKDILARWFDEVWNKQNKDTIDELCSADSIIHGLGENEVFGSEGFKVFQAVFCAAFSNIYTTVDTLIEDGKFAACNYTFRAIHTGEFVGHPASGREVFIKGITIVRTENGQMVETWNQWDALGLLKQISASAEES